MSFIRSLVVLIFLTISALVGAQSIKFDDGFAWFECHNFETAENSVPKSYWVLECNLRVWGKMPDRSGFRVVLKQNGKTISDNMTDGYPVSFAQKAQDAMTVVAYWKDKQRTTLTGPMTVDVFVIDGNTNKETLVRTCKLDVRRVERTRGPVKSRAQYSPQYYVNRHGEILSSILYFRDFEYPSYAGLNGLTWYSARMVELLFNYSENQDFDGPRIGRIVCEVNGQVISMRVPNNEMPQDEAPRGEQAGKYSVEHSDRDAAKYFNQGTAYRERIGFVRRSLVFPLQWGPPLPGREKWNVFTTDHPGDWKITWLIDRKPVRIFRFKIGENGLPLPHPEQKAGLNLGPNAILVDTEIPGSGGDFDGRLTNVFVQQGGFFGRAWATAGMKALAAKVPTKGRPFPVSSAKH